MASSQNRVQVFFSDELPDIAAQVDPAQFFIGAFSADAGATFVVDASTIQLGNDNWPSDSNGEAWNVLEGFVTGAPGPLDPAEQSGIVGS